MTLRWLNTIPFADKLMFLPQGRALDEIPPFFVQGFREDKEVQTDGITDGGSNYNKEAHMGVPTHYQNDGSCLYLLTPVISPPSADITRLATV